MAAGSELLDGCPGAAHVGWLFDAARETAIDPPPVEAREHVALDGDVEGSAAVNHVVSLRTTPIGQATITGWYESRTGDVRVTFRSADDRVWDLSVVLEPTSERIDSMTLLRHLDGVDLFGRAPGGATSEERAAVHALFDRAFRDGDHDYLDDQLDRLALGAAWHDGAVIGFNLAQVFAVELPVVGTQRLWTQGLTCVDPTVQRRGVATSLPAITGVHIDRSSPHQAYVARYANPASLMGTIQINGAPWPGYTLTELIESYRAATPSQRAVGRAVAGHLGSADFDDANWICVGRGRPVGEAVVDIDAPAEAWELFAHADHQRGDTLLGLHWFSSPATWAA